MKLLFRTKKKELEGFKDFVKNLETTPKEKMFAKFFACSLEDPVYMSWVAKNMFSAENFLDIGGEEIEQVVSSLKTNITALQRAYHQTPWEGKLMESILPATRARYRVPEDLEILKDLPANEREISLFSLFKAYRALLNRDEVQNHPWRIPLPDIIKTPKSTEPNCKFEQFFEDGKTLALSGTIKKGQRHGVWDHFFTTGQLMARGEYKEDEMDGHWTFYFSDGVKKGEGYYAKGKRVGSWKEWSKNGVQRDIDYGTPKEEIA